MGTPILFSPAKVQRADQVSPDLLVVDDLDFVIEQQLLEALEVFAAEAPVSLAV